MPLDRINGESLQAWIDRLTAEPDPDFDNRVKEWIAKGPDDAAGSH